MGASIQPHRGRGSRRRRSHQMSEINVTPMVDVMLVLLIIFMVTAPLLTTGVKIDLPQANAPALDQDKMSLTISVAADGSVYIQDYKTTVEAMAATLGAVTDVNADSRIYVRGDASINYGRVMEVMSVLKGAGYTKVALVTLPGGPAKNAGKK